MWGGSWPNRSDDLHPPVPSVLSCPGRPGRCPDKLLPGRRQLLESEHHRAQESAQCREGALQSSCPLHHQPRKPHWYTSLQFLHVTLRSCWCFRVLLCMCGPKPNLVNNNIWSWTVKTSKTFSLFSLSSHTSPNYQTLCPVWQVRSRAGSASKMWSDLLKRNISSSWPMKYVFHILFCVWVQTFTL